MISIISCLSNKKSKGVDTFYTTSNYGQFQLLPLSKPIKLTKDDQSGEWWIDMSKHSLNHNMNIDELIEIGIDESYIYGSINPIKKKLKKYKKEDFVYAGKYSDISWSSKPTQFEGEIRLYPIDSNSRTFIIPKRWFIIDSKHSTIDAFFSKKKYEDYLTEKGISGKMYDINKYHQQYKETGIVPWFPDSVKVKLKRGT